MTYCAGWKYQGAVFLIGDAAETKDEEPRLKYSSFGQLHSATRGGYVEEALVKLVPISKSIAVAYAGDVQIAKEILELLKENVAYAKSATDLVHFLNSIGPFDPAKIVELLIASSISNGDTELIKWDTRQGVDHSNDNYLQIGSLPSFHSILPAELTKIMAARNLDVDKVLPTITSVIQAYGMQTDLIQMNIGGLIFGLSTSLGKVNWQEDTNYVLYSQSLSYISAIARDNVLVVKSSITNDTRVFAHSISVNLDTVANQDWKDRAQEQLDSDSFHYWAFISVGERIVLLLIRENLNEKSKLVQLSNLGEGKLDLAISSELKSLLDQPIENKSNVNTSFRIIQVIEEHSIDTDDSQNLIKEFKKKKKRKRHKGNSQ